VRGSRDETRGRSARRAGRVNEMTLQPRSDSWRRYLEAELSGRDSEAEVVLAELFTALPRHSPAAGFAARVVARAIETSSRRSLFAARAIRWSLAAALLVAAVGAGLVAPMVPELTRLVGPGRVVAGFVALGGDLAVRVATGFVRWQPLVDLGATLARAVGSPTVLALLALQLLLAASALRGLAALAAKGSPVHVAS
jgi:hypothetical protein